MITENKCIYVLRVGAARDLYNLLLFNGPRKLNIGISKARDGKVGCLLR